MSIEDLREGSACMGISWSAGWCNVKPRREKLYSGGMAIYVDGMMLTGHEIWTYLRSCGWANWQIKSYLEKLRNEIEMDDDY